MTVESFIFLILVGVVGGVIALIADRLGRTLGKKRLSLFKQRPRRTAEILTFGAGFLIPILTVFFVMAISKDVRQWIADAPGIIRQRDQLNAEVRQDKVALDSANATLVINQHRLTDTNKSLVALNERSLKLQDQVRQRTADLAKRTADLRSAQLRVSTAERQATTTRARVVKLQRDYESIHHNYEALQKTLADDQKTYENLKRDYASLTAERNRADQEVIKDQKQLDKLGDQLRDIQVDLAQATADYRKAQDDLRLVRDDYGNALTALEQVQSQKEQFGDLSTRMLQEPLIFNVGEELARVSVPSAATRDEAAKDLEDLLDKASDVAAAKGAKRSQQAGDRAAGFLPIAVFDQGVRVGEKSPQSQVDEFIQALLDAKKDSVVIAKAQYNSFNGVFVSLVLERYDNPLVYKMNQAIAETTIQGSGSDSDIYEQISTFVRDKVAERARENKMVPVSGGQESLGEVSSKEIFDLVEKIRAWGRNARLIAEAKQDTRAGDPLALNFELRQ